MIRKAKERDLPEMYRVYAAARAIMQKSGNPTQWGDGKPTEAEVAADVSAGRSYVVVRDGKLCGAFLLLYEPEPTYASIDGAWQSDAPYITLHRVASDGTQSGVLHEILEFCDRSHKNLRIDTHENNRIMRHLLEKEGFSFCGTIRLLDGAPRLAFQRDRTKEKEICKLF